MEEIKLKVGELTERADYGRGIARMDNRAMRKLSAKEGDAIEIEGNRKTAAIVVRAYPVDVGLDVVRIDGLERRNCGAGIGEKVNIRKIEPKEAKQVTLAPAKDGVIIRTSPNLLKRNLLKRPVVKGDIIIPNPVVKMQQDRGNSMFEELFGINLGDAMFTPFGETKFVVAKTSPSEPVQIGDMTELKLLPKAVKVKEEKFPDVTYEDIGGLHEEIRKVREMIELPLKQPELFQRLGIDPPKGVLLYGPPGTGKTLLAKAVANEVGAHFISLNGPEIMCVGGETPILTDDGLSTAEDIYGQAKEEGKIVDKAKGRETVVFDGTDVLSMNPDMKIEEDKITEVTKLKAKGITVETDEGTVLTVSKNQPFATLDGKGDLTWKKTEDLKEGDYIMAAGKIDLKTKDKIDWMDKLDRENVYLRFKDSFGEEEMKLNKALDSFGKDALQKNVDSIAFSPTTYNLKRMNWVKPVDRADPEFMRFLGSMFAEGSISGRMDEVCFANTNLGFRKEIATHIQNLFNLNGSDSKYGQSKFTVYSKTLSHFLNKVCGLPLGRKDELHVPDFLFNASQNNICSFISGYFDGDGTVSYNKDYPTPRFYSKNREFLLELQGLMLSRLSIPTKLTDWKTPLDDLYALTVMGNGGRKRFKETIFRESNKKKDWKLSGKPFGEDIVPVASLLKKAKEKLGLKYGKEVKESSIEPYISGRKKLTRRKLKEILKLFKPFGQTEETEKMRKILQSDVRFTKVKRIENKGKTELYDFGVEKNSNFLGGLPFTVLHNSKWYGQSEQNLRKMFEEAEKNAPAIVFIDEIDAIAPKREEVSGEVERRVVSQLLTLMDGLKTRGKVIVIAATNRQNAVDPALRRPGRFDREIEFGVPDKKGRKEILQIHTRGMPLDKNVDLKHMSAITYGYVGADLEALCKEAAMRALRRVLPDVGDLKKDQPLPKDIMEKLVVNQDDFDYALKIVEPSAMREVLVEVPKVGWKDVGGLKGVKEELKECVEWPLKNPDSFKNLGIKPPKGVLLFGPPGCGKTLLARAVANESDANFISIKGAEVLSKWVGESEKHVREIFRRAKQVAPAIVFFDEIDAIASHRGKSSSDVSDKVISQLLTEMSGLEEMEGIVVIAATNRPDMIDPGLLRPGRFDRHVQVPVPDQEARHKIFEIHTQKMPLGKGIDLKKLAKKTQGYSGADIEAVCREAALAAMRKNRKAKKVTSKHFKHALKEVTPSVSKEMNQFYENVIGRVKEAATGTEELDYTQ